MTLSLERFFEKQRREKNHRKAIYIRPSHAQSDDYYGCVLDEKGAWIGK